MKRIEITHREQHVLMTVVRIAKDALHEPQFPDAPGVVPYPIGRGPMLDAMGRQPGMDRSSERPSEQELDSIIERLSSNEVT